MFLPEPYIEKIPFPDKVKDHPLITSVITRSEKRTVKPDEKISIEPVVAIIKDLVTKSVEDGHIVF